MTGPLAPPKRTERNLLTYLDVDEVDALLVACDQRTWTGRRDHAMFALTIQTGLRISEVASRTRQDVTLGAGANVHTVGKGRKGVTHATGPPPGPSSRPDWASTPGGSRHPAVSDHHRHPPERRHHRAPSFSPHGPRRPALGLLQDQARHHAHVAAHRCPAPPAGGQRRHRHACGSVTSSSLRRTCTCTPT